MKMETDVLFSQWCNEKKNENPEKIDNDVAPPAAAAAQLFVAKWDKSVDNRRTAVEVY